MLQAVGVVATLIAILCQLRAQNRQLKSQNDQLRSQRQANMLQTLTALDARWDSERMIRARRSFCKEWNNPKKEIKAGQVQVLSFFEDIGLYLKNEVLDHEPVWDKWSHYIEGYWSMHEPYIEQHRAQDPTWYDKFEFLATEMRKMALQKDVQVARMKQADIDEFIQREQGLEVFTRP